MNIKRLINGIITGERLTPATVGLIRMVDEFHSRLFEKAPEGYIAILNPDNMLSNPRKVMLHCVKQKQQGYSCVSHVRRKVLHVNELDMVQSPIYTTLSEGV